MADKNDTHFEKMLILSTAHAPEPHMPDDSPDFRPLRSSDDEYGWVLWVKSVGPEEICDIPGWLLPIWKYASENSCTTILFDRDASKLERFKLYDW